MQSVRGSVRGVHRGVQEGGVALDAMATGAYTPLGYRHRSPVEDNVKDLNVEIGGMSCSGCVRKVTKALQKVDGMLKCEVEVGKAKLSYDDTKIDLQRILDVVRQSGYTVKGELG